jgi:hypothetical protein
MKLSRRNLILRFAYFGDFWVPDKTDLCRVFWRCVVRLLVLGIVAAVVTLLGVILFSQPVVFLLVALIVGVSLMLAIGVGLVAAGVGKVAKTDVVATIKRNYCPVIEVE